MYEYYAFQFREEFSGCLAEDHPDAAQSIHTMAGRCRSTAGHRSGAQRRYPRAHRALLRVKLGGLAFVVSSQWAMKPTSVTLPPFAGITGFQLGLPTATWLPPWLTVPFHSCWKS